MKNLIFIRILVLLVQSLDTGETNDAEWVTNTQGGTNTTQEGLQKDRITFTWLTNLMQENSGNSLPNGHWDYPFCTKEGWENQVWSSLPNRVKLSLKPTFIYTMSHKKNRLGFEGLKHLHFWVILKCRRCLGILLSSALGCAMKLCEYHKKLLRNFWFKEVYPTSNDWIIILDPHPL